MFKSSYSFHSGLKILFVSVFFALWFSSCRTSREVSRSVVRPVNTNKLLKNIEQNAFDYEYFTIRKINCNFSDKKSKSTFKISLKALKDEKILVSISKLNIPVGRVMLTPDSVKYVNYIDRNYFVDDYSFLSDFLNIDLDFKSIQSIISNNAFSYRNDPHNKDFKTFDSFIEDGMHVLQSEKKRKMFKMTEKGKTGKIERRLKRLDDEALILQKMYFDPGSYALKKLEIVDQTNRRNMEMLFANFTEVRKKDYPGSIDMRFDSPSNNVNVKVKMSGFSTEKINSLSIKIPSKYEQIKVN